MIVIDRFRAGDDDQVTALIVPIQNQEFGIPITAADQPDLAAIPDFYQHGHGGFWVAREGARIVGTIALKDFGDDQGALRKMFVAADRRGRDHGVAAGLLATLIAHARGVGVTRILLGTVDVLVAAHRFYEKNGFVRIDKRDLPAAFPLVAVDTRFYALTL